MEAGANAAAVPIRDKQKAVFMVSIGIGREELVSASRADLSKKTQQYTLKSSKKDTFKFVFCTFLLSLPIILLSTVFEKI